MNILKSVICETPITQEHFYIPGGDDSQNFTLVTRPGSEKAELLTMTDLDYESPKKKFDLIIRAASAPLRSDAHVEIIVTDVNDNAPVLKDFHVLFNNFRDCFPTGPIGRIPAYDADVTDKLHFRILSGNNANLVALNDSTGQLQLSPQLNTNVPKIASMEVSVSGELECRVSEFLGQNIIFMSCENIKKYIQTLYSIQFQDEPVHDAYKNNQSIILVGEKI